MLAGGPRVGEEEMEELLKAPPLTLALVSLVLLLGGQQLITRFAGKRGGDEGDPGAALPQLLRLAGEIDTSINHLALRIGDLQRQLSDYTEQVEMVARLEVEAKGLSARFGKIDGEMERVRDRIDKIEEVSGRTEVILRGQA